MKTGKNDGTLLCLSLDDVGTKVDDVTVVCSRILFQQPGKNFQAFITDSGISCSVNSSLQLVSGNTYKVSGAVGTFRGNPQLTIDSIEAVQNDDFIKNVYSSFLFGAFERSGLTSRMADKIVDCCGDSFMDRLINSPQDVALNVKGLSEDRAVKIGEELLLNKNGYGKLIDLMKAGLSYRQAVLCSRRTDITAETIKTNPFCLAVIGSFSFSDCEAISRGKNIRTLDKHRVFSALRSVIEQLHAGTANTYFDVPEIEAAVKKIVVPGGADRSVITDYPSAFELACEFGVEQGYLTVYHFKEHRCVACNVRDEGARIASSEYFKAEAQIKKEVERFVKARYSKPDEELLDDTIRSLAEEYRIDLDQDQMEALRLCMYRPICVITGGPGVGKTTIMGLLSAYFQRKNIKCVFAAPTGRAAKRLAEATGMESFTIHRLLEACAESGEGTDIAEFFFRRNHENPVDARVIVIDEMSMVDTLLFRSLLSAVGKGTSVILIGDPDQLPSVGCGNVLADLISCDSIPCINLKTIHRQDEGGSIASNAARILNGEELFQAHDFRIIKCSGEEVLAKVCDLYDELSSECSDVVVLSPTKQPQLQVSTASINGMLQTWSHQADELAGLANSGIGRFVAGDKIMQIKNNYAIEYYDPAEKSTGEGVFNGEFGRVMEIDDASGELRAEYEDGKLVTYGTKEIDNIDLAYAITVHKSQGCEFEHCIIVLGKMNRLLCRRNILYTAVTRGKRSVTIIDSDNTLKAFLEASNSSERKTSLKDLLAIIDHKRNQK
ncbi:MAG: AAA family ATPase [Clostridiales bacterium]|nr:AAA family ATPase [Clostridiales bacterium]